MTETRFYEYESCQQAHDTDCIRITKSMEAKTRAHCDDERSGKCTVCAKLPLRRRPLGQSLLFNSMEHIDIDFGLFEIVNRVELEEDYMVDSNVARRTADNALKHVKYFRKMLHAAGLLQEKNQNFSGQSCRARVVAPFSRAEVIKGRILGSGGFSSVYEIEGFQPDDVLSAGVTQVEEVSRNFLSEHALRTGLEKKDRFSSSEIPRYAVKHLKHNLVSDPERFERAAIDLVLEGQLLLAMDHPNIIGIRGWSYAGAEAFSSGKYTDYFLILDRLSETGEMKVERWRDSLRKYRSRQVTMRWKRKKYMAKVHDQFVERIDTALGVANALEYMHDRRIIHRDIKIANIGFDFHDDVKVFDFGLSRMLPDESEKDSNGAYLMSRVGTKVYMAPEVRSKKPYNLSADVYSFGVVLWELLALATPSEKMLNIRGKLEEQQVEGEWLPLCPCWPIAIQDLIQSCLSYDPSKRPFIGEVRQTLLQVLVGNKDLSIPQRRRSTFRIDLSTEQPSESAGSKTSHTSSLFESEHLTPAAKAALNKEAPVSRRGATFYTLQE